MHRLKLLDSDLSTGYSYSVLEQLGPEGGGGGGVGREYSHMKATAGKVWKRTQQNNEFSAPWTPHREEVKDPTLCLLNKFAIYLFLEQFSVKAISG